MAGFTVNGGYHIKQSLPDIGVSYDCRLITVETDLFVPENVGPTTRFSHPKKFYQIGQITAYSKGFVVYHAYLEFEKQYHGVFLTDIEVVMPIFNYPDTWFSTTIQTTGIAPEEGTPIDGGSSIKGGHTSPNTQFGTDPLPLYWKGKTMLLTVEYIAKLGEALGLTFVPDEIELNPEEWKERWVIESKPYLMGWLRAIDEIEIEVFESGCSCTLIVEELR